MKFAILEFKIMDKEFDSDEDEFHQPTNLDEAEVNEGSDEEMQSLDEEYEPADIEVQLFSIYFSYICLLIFNN